MNRWISRPEELAVDVLQYVRQLFRSSGDATQTDRQLLLAFASQREESAFATLVHRHGPLVWGVCRRGLSAADAEDAFQATFLILARKADTLVWHDGIGPWLYGVAVRVVRKARTQALQRRRHELTDQSAKEPPMPDPVVADELRALLDDEIQRLPVRYQRVLILCYLEGHTYAQAARTLGWPEGTVSGRLARARDLLRQRLLRRGFAPTSTLPVLLPSPGETITPPVPLLDSTIRGALAFAAGPGIMNHPAAALAEGVLHNMLMKKMQVAVLLVGCTLALGGIGLAWVNGAWANRAPISLPPSEPPRPDAPPPALPGAWENRWTVNPFAQATALTIRHSRRGAPGKIYEIKQADVLARCLKAIKLTGVQNNIAIGLIPPATLVLQRKQGEPLSVPLLGEDQFQFPEGILSVDESFVQTLNQELSKAYGTDIDLTVFLPAAENANTSPVAPSRKSLTEGFRKLSVQYRVGAHAFRTEIADRDTLSRLQRQVKILAQQPLKQEETGQASLEIEASDGSTFFGQFVREDVLFDPTAGRFTLEASFLRELTKEVSKRLGRPVNLLGENPLTPAENERLNRFSQFLGTVRTIQFPNPRRQDAALLKVTTPEAVKELLSKLTLHHAPMGGAKPEKTKWLAEFLDEQGRSTRIHLVETGAARESGPILSDLLDVSGFGLLWVSNQWRSEFGQYAYEQERIAQAEREMQTARLVCENLPLFLRHVLGMTVSFREGEGQSRTAVNRPELPPVLDALASGRFEKLDWTEQRWQMELEALERQGAGALEVAPGLGFTLMLLVRGETEMLVFPQGRLRFEKSPLPAIIKAMGEEPGKINLLPRPGK